MSEVDKAKVQANIKAVFDEYGEDTMAGLARRLYKGTEAGVSIGFWGPDFGWIYNGDERQRTIKEPWRQIHCIGISSIVEGSDAEVPLTIADATLPAFMGDDGPECFVAAFKDIVQNVNDLACELWEEANGED